MLENPDQYITKVGKFIRAHSLDTAALENDMGFKPNTSLRMGLRKFAEWYKVFYNV